MICRLGLALLVVCMASLPGHALASEIVMVVTTSVTVTEQSVDVRLEVDNRGDEDALVVTPFLTLAGVKTGLETASHIAFDGRRIWIHRFPVSDLLIPEPGAYPLVVQLRYHDAHMYPYSLVNVTGVQTGERLPRKDLLEGEMVADRVSGDGNLDLRIRNTGEAPVETRITMVSPAGIEVTGDSSMQNIPAGEEKQIGYVIRNKGALPGSNHNVYALIEYSLGGQHGVVILEEAVAVASHVSGKKRRIIIASAGFVMLLFFLVLFIEFRTGASAA